MVKSLALPSVVLYQIIIFMPVFPLSFGSVILSFLL